MNMVRTRPASAFALFAAKELVSRFPKNSVAIEFRSSALLFLRLPNVETEQFAAATASSDVKAAAGQGGQGPCGIRR